MGQRYQPQRQKSRGQRPWPGQIERLGPGEQVSVQLPLPLAEVLAATETAVEQLAGEAGLLLMQAAMEAEVERRAGRWHERQPSRAATRWGAQPGYVVFAGRKVPLHHPRLRQPGGRQEVPLATYAAFQADGRLQRAVATKLLLGLSTRTYERAVEAFCQGYGVKKSSVSRHFVRASAATLRDLMERPLGHLDLVVVVIDGLEFAGHLVVVALGVDVEGRKHILGLWQGATENQAVCRGLVEDLIRRGLAPGRRYLFVLDGSKALKKAIQLVFGEEAVIQRCQQHKRQNVRDHLPPEHQAAIDARLRAAYTMASYEEARQSLERTARHLDRLNPSAAASLREGLEETLTLHRLGVPERLRPSLRTTNLIESCFAATRHLTRNVKRWRSGAMVQRWAAAALLSAEQRFRRLKGYREMPHLVVAIRQPRVGERTAA